MDLAIDISNSILETERLTLRPWRESDVHDFFAYARVEGVGEMAGWPPHESIETTKQVLQAFICGKSEFAIVEKKSGKVIGSVGLHESWANNDPELAHLTMKNIGYVLSKDYWGQGIMPEAVAALVQYCFGEWGLDALTCGHIPANRQSQRVIEKCGFSYVKQSRYEDEQMQMTFSGRRYILHRPQG